MHTAPSRPGLMVIDASLGLLAYNGEAVQILTFPDQPEKIRNLETWLANKVRSNFVGRQSPPRFVDAFRSSKRMYLCRCFPLDFKNNGLNHGLNHTDGNGSTVSSASSNGLLIVMLERKSNEAVSITEISERFGLTAREQETVQFLLQGFTSKEIAQRMNISPNTVKAFLRLVMVKMNVSTRSGIIGRMVAPRV